MRRALPLVGLSLSVLVALPAMAKEGDTFQPFVSLAYFYDDNLFRLADSESTDYQRDDRYGLVSAGVNVDWKPGRQQIVANATKTLIRYDSNSFLDFDGDDLQATWNWRLGNRLSGNVGAASSTTQSSFEDIGQVNNQVDRERRYGRAEWEFHPRWRIGGGVAQTDNTNSTQIDNDFEQLAKDVVLGYRTPKGSNVRLQVRRVDADFPTPEIQSRPPVVVVADNSYTQDEYNLLGDWRVGGKLTLRGQAGWVDRRYENALRGGFVVYEPWFVPRPDFSGFTGRLTGEWYASAKTLLSVSGYRELGGTQDINATSVLKKGASVNGVWLMREKWRLNAGATFEDREFQGDPGQKNDDTLGASLSVSYAPIKTVSIDVGGRAGRRDSSIPADDYSFRSVFASVRADF